MSSRLEQFINDHREAFDTDEPGKKVWENIREQIDPVKKQQAAVIGLNWKKWSVAAAVVVLLGAGGLYITNRNSTTIQPVANNTKPAADKTQKVQPDTTPADGPQLAQSTTPQKQEVKKDAPVVDDQLADMNEEMYHFAKLVEIKHKELKKIQKDEPLLYQQFAGDVNKLDSVYHSLEKQLPENPNREQLIEAMIQNLQLQMDLLNHQLTIIKQINHSKKSAYEQAFKST